MICKNCGKEFEGKFCPDCGTMVEDQPQWVFTQCPNCGADRLDNGRFCVNCGYNFDEPAQFANAQIRKPNLRNANSNKFLGIFAKIYRWLIAGGMIFVGIVSLLCLSAPVITEELFGMKEALCTGFQALSGGDVPANIVNASRMLLTLSIICVAYGGFQLYLAFKKPYITIKKYYLWAIDGVISLILLILGAVVASEANSDMLINGKLGSGFAMCIVMGVFGLVFLGLRIFYELKVFNWEDIGQETYDKIVRAEKQRKPIDKEKAKKIAIKVGIPVIIVAVLVAIIVPTVLWSQNIFRVGKVDKIDIGDSKEDVIKVLGEPYEKSDYRFEYYSDD
ncbi:MAG: zinc ribbon domain-containing protein, partial [Clostridia bacterium]|nr:zinc ribbon domain-containing protein [Clostridia bacterium]